MNTPGTLEALAGGLRLRPGRPRPHNLQGTRRHWAEALARGRPATGLPDLMAGLYSLCGGAHRQAARLAITAAAGENEGPRQLLPASLRRETLREHLRRILLDWPQAAGAQATRASALATCPALQIGEQGTSGSVDDMQPWLARHLLGLPPRAWWARWQHHPGNWLAEWGLSIGPGMARWLSPEKATVPAQPAASRPLQVHAADPALGRLHALLQADPAFALAPLWQGRCADTGPWARLAPGPQVEVPGALGLRLGARLAEAVALCLPAEESPLLLQCGSLAVAPGEGLGWVEMARGLLVHSVRLEGHGRQARVDSLRVLAPTEWNFHPLGAVAQVLETCGAEADTATLSHGLRRLMAAYDPCVRFEVEPALEHSDA